jgi:hypothetical protein
MFLLEDTGGQPIKSDDRDTSFIRPVGEQAAEAFQSLFSQTEGKIQVRMGAEGRW